jgi:pyruvate/2-oxoglutarate dehydrogenase complex dihydrolipoamide acyltransferase (E2) component
MAGDDGGRKRGGRPWKGGQGDGKRHKGALAAAANAKGSGGVLVTCDKTKERQSVRDALNLLNEAADKYFPSQEQQDKEHKDKEDDKNEEQGSKSVQEMLAAEVAALKADAKQRRTGRFTALDTVRRLAQEHKRRYMQMFTLTGRHVRVSRASRVQC